MEFPPEASSDILILGEQSHPLAIKADVSVPGRIQCLFDLNRRVSDSIPAPFDTQTF